MFELTQRIIEEVKKKVKEMTLNKIVVDYIIFGKEIEGKLWISFEKSKIKGGTTVSCEQGDVFVGLFCEGQ